MENPNEETIKCVIVGDSNVGKTRLICSRAYKQYDANQNYSRYGGTHIPTVWANDHYRNDPVVLDNSRDNIDGVAVSLRLWDTFGDHSNNRKFAYGRADCIIVCFSICDPRSLYYLKMFWMPEIRRHCKRVPVIIVGCKIDLRFADLDDLNRKKVTLAKRIDAGDILYPEICRNTAADLGCPYYEVSISLGYGVKEVFENAIRAALLRRKGPYLYGNLHMKNVRKPLLQQPLTPPKPPPPAVANAKDDAPLNFDCLYCNLTESDLKIVGVNFTFNAHKVILAIASDVFHNIFKMYSKTQFPIPVSYFDNNIPTDYRNLTNHNDCEDVNCNFNDDYTPAFVLSYDSENSGCDVLTLAPDISEFAFRNVMQFIYTGCLHSDCQDPVWLKNHFDQYSHLLVVGNKFGINHFVELLELTFDEDPGRIFPIKEFDLMRKNRINAFMLGKIEYADIMFQTDDGCLPAHKALLISGSDMMSAMFGSDFIESGNKILKFPETTSECLQIAFEFIYTNEISFDLDFGPICDDIIALADRLCLPQLVGIIEARLIDEFEQKSSISMTRELHENVINALEVAQFYNAHSLAEWCIHYISTNYNDVCRKCKPIKGLSEGNLKRIEKSRWPPVWFIKDLDAYERACKKRFIETKNPKKY